MISLSIIHEIICTYFNVDYMFMFQRNRKKRVIYIRQMFHYIARKINGNKISFEEIGSYLGDISEPFDHCTVIYSCNKTEGYLSYDKGVQKDVKNILKLINNG
jgi:chromosomal replication initiation ATPase DnaA